MQILANRLRTRSRELNLTDVEVARRAGLSERRYGNYVTGTRRPSYETLLRLCSVLGTSPNHLLGFEMDPELDEAALLKNRIDAAWNILAPEGRELAADLLESLVNNQLRRQNAQRGNSYTTD